MDREIDVTGPFSFDAEVFYWRGPSPFFFAAVPAPEAAELRRVAGLVTYGWGMIPVEAAIGDVTFHTSLFPRDGAYLLPVRADVRRRAGTTAGDRIHVRMTVRPAER